MAKKVAQAAIKTGVARIKIDPEVIQKNAEELIKAVKEREI